ncbi:hypothetical protein [Streptomyces tirandamycinicus]|uniref:hypothetical protein n=1 Tax=Streptomyces tirandamycinicus TaxID=2174846 RepID=UPI0011B1D15F|nr:hypothetical protein [Streptomyces tirandamycinicus]
MSMLQDHLDLRALREKVQACTRADLEPVALFVGALGLLESLIKKAIKGGSKAADSPSCKGSGAVVAARPDFNSLMSA